MNTVQKRGWSWHSNSIQLLSTRIFFKTSYPQSALESSAFHGNLSDRTCKACDGWNPRCILTSQLSWMNPEREEEESSEAIFPLKALGPTQILYVSMSMFARASECRAALISLAAAGEGGREGGVQHSSPCRALVQDNHRQPLLTSILSPITPQLLCWSRPAANRGRDPYCMSDCAVFNSLHDCTVTVLPRCLTPRTDTYFLKRGIL